MKNTKRILITATLSLLLFTFSKATVDAAEIVPMEELQQDYSQYLENLEAIFSDGSKGQFIDIDGNDIVWTTKVTSLGNKNHDVARLQYIVQKGDCLWNIASAFHIPINQLLSLNYDIENPNLIYPEDTITLMIIE